MAYQSDNVANGNHNAALEYNKRLKNVIEKQMSMVQYMTHTDQSTDTLNEENVALRAVGEAYGVLIDVLRRHYLSPLIASVADNGSLLAMGEAAKVQMDSNPSAFCLRALIANTMRGRRGGAFGGTHGLALNGWPRSGSFTGPIAGIIDASFEAAQSQAGPSPAGPSQACLSRSEIMPKD